MLELVRQYKDYQLQACYNRMKQLKKDCSDNLTERVCMEVISAIGEEAHNRGLRITYSNGYYDIK
jgi:hypothetical protein